MTTASVGPFELSRAETDDLVRILGDGATSKTLSRRARIVLLSARGLGAKQIADELGFTQLTVYKWRRRYRVNGIAGLSDLARPGQPRKLPPDARSEIVALTRYTIPPDATHWSIRRMARFARVTEHQVRRIWHEERLNEERPPRHSTRANELLGVGLGPRLGIAVFELSSEEPSSSLESPRVKSVEPNHRNRTNVYALFDCAAGRAKAEPVSTPDDLLSRLAPAVREEARLFVSLLDDAALERRMIAELGAHHLEFEHLPTVGAWLGELERRCSKLERSPDERARHGVLEFRRSARAFVAARRSSKRNAPFSWIHPNAH